MSVDVLCYLINDQEEMMMTTPKQDVSILNSLVGFIGSSQWHSKMVRMLVGFLIICMGIWVLTSTGYLMVLLYNSIIMHEWDVKIEHMITSVIMILVLLEIIRILKSYLDIGRVRVTFILDAALVVLVGELIGLWYKENTSHEVVMSLAVIFALVIFRIITNRFSPDNETSEGS